MYKRPGLSLLMLLIFIGGFNSLKAQYAVNGDASRSGNCFTLTPDQPWKNGSVWYLDRVDISTKFELYFEIFLGCRDGLGADGLAFVLQQVSTSIGSQGEGIGYQGISPSIAIEFDNFQNGNRFDPAIDHVAIMKNGVVNHNSVNNLSGPTSILSSGGNAEDCQWHDLKITWDPDTQKLRVFVDCDLRLTYTGDIINDIFNGDSRVFWGFTSATGGYSNRHEFCLDFVSFVEELQDTAICTGESVQLNVGSGDEFKWTPSIGLSSDTIANPIATPDTTTTYFVEVIDGCNLPRYDTITVYVQDSLDKIFTEDYRLCPDGEILIVPDYPFANFLWDNGSTADTFLATQPGEFTLQVSSRCGSFSDTFTVLPPLLPDLQVFDVLCQGQNNGRATLNLQIGTASSLVWGLPTGAPVKISSAGLMSDEVTGLEPGTYLYLSVDSAGCLLRDSFQITEPDDLQLINPVTTDVDCNGQATGRLAAEVLGGVAPYAFSINGGAFQANPNFSNLSAGSYVLTVRDSNDCEESLSFLINESPPIQISLDSMIGNPCFGDSLGKLFFTASGGTGNLEYALGAGAFQANGIFTGLAAGSYQLRVRDALGCENTFNVAVSQPPLLSPFVDLQKNVDCFGNSSGAVKLASSGGAGSYRFSFNNSPFTQVDSFFSLSAGTYSFAVQDDSACVSLDSFEITQPDSLILNLDQLIDVACFGDSTGSVQLSGAGGSGSYYFALGNGPFDTNSMIGGLAVGTYTFLIRDDSSCQNSIQANIAEPTLLQASASNILGVDCLGNQSGGMTLQGMGGTPPYMYAFRNSGNVSTGYRTGTFFDSLYAGPYTGQVLDANGCLAEVDTFIPTPTSLRGGIDTLIDVDCFGASTGSILMFANGGTAPYEYSFDGVNFAPGPFFGGLSSRRDTVILRDANACIIPVPFIIGEPDSLVLSVENARDIACFGGNSGEISLGVSGGVGPFDIVMNTQPGVRDTFFSNLAAGTYNFTLTDANGCTAGVSTALLEPDSLEIIVDSIIPASCFGDRDGSIELSPQGGVAPYQFAFIDSTFGSISSFDSLPAGRYQIQLLDDSACNTTMFITVEEPDTLVLSLEGKLDILCHGENTGRVELSFMGGNNLFSYSVDGSPNQSEPIFDSLLAGTYLFEIVDEKACSDSLEITLFEPNPLELNLLRIEDVDCFGNGNGEILVASFGGMMPYELSLNGVLTVSDSLFEMLEPGFYDIILTDSFSCQDTLSGLEITQPDSLVVDLTGSDVLCHGENSGSLVANVSGGTMPYEYLWDGNPDIEGELLDNIVAADYRIEVLDANGCIDDAEATISQPDTLLLALDSIKEAYCDLANGYASIKATGGVGTYDFVWVGSSTYQGASQSAIEGGSFITRVLDGNGCIDTLRIVVPQDPPPVPNFISDPPIDQVLLLSEAQNMQFVNQSSTNSVEYLWDLDAPLGLFDTEDVEFSYTEEGTYVISLTAYNKYYVCPVTYTDTLRIIPDGQLEVANAFTPNGDGINDEFFLVGKGIVDFSFVIFNKWGKQVYSFSSIEDEWDGRNFNGVKQPEGVYVYRLQATFNSGEKIDRAGTITLVR